MIENARRFSVILLPPACRVWPPLSPSPLGAVPPATFKQLDKALRANGWRYDRGDEVFPDRSGKIIRDYRKLLALVPGMNLDQLASYQDDKADKRRTPA